MSENWEKNLELPDDVEYFGGCPHCTLNDGHINVGRMHWMVCHKHSVKWCVGSNLFSGWRNEDEATWVENAHLLETYKEVKSLTSPSDVAR